MKKIKHISQRKQNGDFSNFIPLGADGLNIDMLSGSNLEEEMHLGSPSKTSFTTDEFGSTIITEEYKKNNNQTDNYYVMKTSFETDEDENMVIVQRLYFVIEEELVLKRIKKISFDSSEGSLIIKEELE